uniref:Ribosome biogenesis protein NOP53 n=1 Tax=Strigamia maritima TaxID=126957 RepID=T1IQQ4_STRMM
MAPVKEASTQQKPKKTRIRGSKHKKKNWRRDNIKDVEDFLDEKRKDDRFRSKAQRTDDELFRIQRKISERGKLLDDVKKNAVPKFRYLDADGEIEPIIKPTKTKRITRNPIQKAKFKVAESKIKKNRTGNQFLSLWTPNKDIWQDDKKMFENQYLQEADEYFQLQTCKKQIKPPSSYYTKPSTLPAVEVPDPGASYNPDYEDHQKLLLKAREIEVKKRKEEQHLNRVLTQQFPSKEDAPTEATWLQEMSQGMNPTEVGESESEIDIEDLDFLSVNPPTLNNKKTKAKRNKEMKQKLIEKKLKKEKSERKRENEVYKIKSFLTTIKKKERLTKERLIRRQKRKIKEMAKPGRLGRVKYEDPLIELTLTDELKGTLREMKATKG